MEMEEPIGRKKHGIRFWKTKGIHYSSVYPNYVSDVPAKQLLEEIKSPYYGRRIRRKENIHEEGF